MSEDLTSGPLNSDDYDRTKAMEIISHETRIIQCDCCACGDPLHADEYDQDMDCAVCGAHK